MSGSGQVQIPDKLFYKINEVATITQVKPYVLRYWETEFPLLSPEKDENDQRRYRRSDIELVLQIKNLLYEQKYTIAGARKQLKAMREGGSQRSAQPEKPSVLQMRRINSSLGDLRRDIAEVYKLLA
ncbi:MAG: MerR family transcriptional regulator [Candidatus Sumerlaeaceae bacterium]|nr:MerR family transcriptional regulator [Candidatus Sumerlaeaceae bacterium]